MRMFWLEDDSAVFYVLLEPYGPREVTGRPGRRRKPEHPPTCIHRHRARSTPHQTPAATDPTHTDPTHEEGSMTTQTAVQDGKRTRSVHPVDQVLPPTKLAVYGIQHVLAFYAGAVIVPILLASALHLTEPQLVYLINADLFTCGIASIIQTVGFWKIGVRLPLLQGVTFTAVAPMISIGLAEGGGVPGLKAIYGAVIVGGIVAFLIAPFFSQLIRFFPPIVTGTVILCIGLVLLPVAAQEAGGGNPAAKDFGSIKNMVLAG